MCHNSGGRTENFYILFIVILLDLNPSKNNYLLAVFCLNGGCSYLSQRMLSETEPISAPSSTSPKIFFLQSIPSQSSGGNVKMAMKLMFKRHYNSSYPSDTCRLQCSPL